MRFKLIDEAKKEFPVHRLCSVFGVSESGYFAWKEPPASRRQNEDLILLAHIRTQFSTSNETYAHRACMWSSGRTALKLAATASPD